MLAQESQPSVAFGAPTISSHQTHQASGELAALVASVTATGLVGRWPYPAATFSATTVAFAALETSRSAAIPAGAPVHERDAGSATGSNNSVPGPGPTPGGAGGGSAAGAGSGAASSGFVDTGRCPLAGRAQCDAAVVPFPAVVAHVVLRADSRATGLAPFPVSHCHAAPGHSTHADWSTVHERSLKGARLTMKSHLTSASLASASHFDAQNATTQIHAHPAGLGDTPSQAVVGTRRI